jgi:hypothetical protein
MNLKNAVLIVSLAVAIFSTTYLLKSGCRGPGPQPGAPAVSVTPITDPETLSNLPPLPNHEKPVSAIPVPVPTPKPGHIIQPAVVMSDAGNTFIVYTDRIDWGLRFDPKASLGISTDLLLGVDVSFFTWWRLNADAVVFLPIRSDLDFTRTRAGLGLSGQLSANTSVGLAYLVDLADRRTWAAFVSLKF